MFATHVTTSPLELLSEQDYEDLKSSGLTDQQIIECGHFSVEKPEGKKLGISHKGLVFRYLDPATGSPYLTPQRKPFYRMKPRDWEETWDDPTEAPPKYLSPKRSGNKPYFSPLIKHFNRLAPKTHVPVEITEGEKKADCLAANGILSIGLTGVTGWLDKEVRGEELEIPPAPLIEDDSEDQEFLEKKLTQSRIIPELRDAIEWQYRRINIVFDSDTNHKRQVRGALKDLASALLELGAEPYIVRLPNEPDRSKNGVDDFIVRHGIDAYKVLRQIAKPAFKKNKMDFPKEPTPYEKIILAWSVLKDSWRYRPGVGWYKWTGTHWVNCSTSEFHEAAVAFQDAQGWEIPINKDLLAYQLQSRLLVRDDHWNPTHLLGFANGVLSIKDNAFTEGHNQEDFLTVILPYDYDPTAQCPRWLNFLNEALSGDQQAIDLLQSFIKWVLLPKPRNKKAEIEKCLDLLGTKGTGKGTFLDILIALVGSENIGAIGQKTFGSSTHLADLLDKKLSIDTDAFGFLSDVGIFNKVVSNEPVSIKRLYKDPVTVRLGTVVVRAYNRVLEVPDGAEGLDRRIIAIEFKNQPQVVDLELSEKLQTELPGIFAWAWSVSTAEMKRRITWAGSVQSVASASVKRFEANNPEYSFLTLTFPTGGEAKASDLYHSYVTWCKDDAGISPKKRRKFSEALQALGCNHRRTMDGYFYSIPAMDQFDVVKFLGLSRKISSSEKFEAENVHNVHAMPESTEKSGVSGMNILSEHEHSKCSCPPENVHNLAEDSDIKFADPPFEIGDTFLWGSEEVRVDRIGRSTLYCHVVNGTPEQNSSYIRVPFEEAEKIKNEHSHPAHEHSNVHVPERMFMLETIDGQGIQESHEHYEHSRAQTSLRMKFPSVGCEVGKTIDGERKLGWRGWIREIVDEQTVKVWWGDFDLNRNGKPIKEKDGANREKLTRELIENLCPFPSDAKERSIPYNSQNLPKKGDRIRNLSGKEGEITNIRTKNPRYEVTWSNGHSGHYSLQDLEVMDVRKVEVSHANG